MPNKLEVREIRERKKVRWRVASGNFGDECRVNGEPYTGKFGALELKSN